MYIPSPTYKYTKKSSDSSINIYLYSMENDTGPMYKLLFTIFRKWLCTKLSFVYTSQKQFSLCWHFCFSEFRLGFRVGPGNISVSCSMPSMCTDNDYQYALKIPHPFSTYNFALSTTFTEEKVEDNLNCWKLQYALWVK